MKKKKKLKKITDILKKKQKSKNKNTKKETQTKENKI